jgi:hypothetical protein
MIDNLNYDHRNYNPNENNGLPKNFRQTYDPNAFSNLPSAKDTFFEAFGIKSNFNGSYGNY